MTDKHGADVWVILTPEQVAWLAKSKDGSLTVTSQTGETVRVSCLAPLAEVIENEVLL